MSGGHRRGHGDDAEDRCEWLAEQHRGPSGEAERRGGERRDPDVTNADPGGWTNLAAMRRAAAEIDGAIKSRLTLAGHQ